MNRILFWALLGALSLSALAYPLYQWATNHGYVYFINGFDEYSYLQYDFSVAAQSLTRSGQFVVTWLHRLGLSGGMINVVFDATSLVAFPLLAAAIFRQLGWESAKARVGALLMLVLPLLLGGINPLIDRLHLWNLQSHMIYWFNMPHLPTPAIVRTPEPQWSILLLMTSIWVALKRRAFWPVYVVLPLLYPFIAIPAAFTALALDARRRWPARWGEGGGGALFAAFAAICVACWVYLGLFLDPRVRDLLVASRLPLISLTGLAALGLYGLARPWIAKPARFPLLAIALAPLVASNHQLASGIIAQPDNFEQYFGTFAVAAVATFVLVDHLRLRTLALALGACVFLRASYVTFRTNQIATASLPLTPALLEALRTDAAHTVVNDWNMASVLNLVFPMQPSTALGYDRSFSVRSAHYIDAYRSTKKRILAEHPDDPGLRRALTFLDASYEFSGQNIPFLSLYRKHHFTPLHDVRIPADQPAGPPLRYFFVK